MVSAFDPTVHLAWDDVAIDSGHPLSKICVFLKQSKTDQFCRGVAGFLGATGDEPCPVTFVSFAALRGDAVGLFFYFQEGTLLTKNRFIAQICEAMAQAGIFAENYSSHSFRSGVATTSVLARPFWSGAHHMVCLVHHLGSSRKPFCTTWLE